MRTGRVSVGPMGRSAWLVLVASVALAAGCGGGLTRMQAAARDVGVAYLDLHARDAARAAGVTYSGCPAAQISVEGTGESYRVQACQSRVDVRCTWGAGAPACNPEPELDAMHEAQEARQREARERAAREERARVTVAAPPQRAASAAAFRVGPDGVLQMDAVEGFLELRVRASSEHPDRVLVSSSIVSGDESACDHALVLDAAGATSRIEPTQRDGSTTHYLFEAANFATLGERTPIRMSVCGQTVAFGHPALRALRAFIAADAELAN